jgi:hypothetical protein
MIKVTFFHVITIGHNGTSFLVLNPCFSFLMIVLLPKGWMMQAEFVFRTVPVLPNPLSETLYLCDKLIASH